MTCLKSLVATAKSRDMSARSALSLRIVSIGVFHLFELDADQYVGSKVQCTNCQEYGHTKVRCKAPLAEENDGFGDGGDGGWGGADATAGGDDGYANHQSASGDDGWSAAKPVDVEVSVW